MLKKYTTSLALGAAVMLVSSACAATTVQEGALQPTGGNPATTVVSQDDDAHDDDGHDDATEAVPVDRVVEVELSEFAITTSVDAFLPGETVKFVVTNAGVVEHEFRLSNQGRVDEHVAGGHEDHEEGAMSDEEMAAMDDEEDGDGHEDDGHSDEPEDAALIVGAGETASMVFAFPDNTGDYTVQVCLIPGHYEAGMAADLAYDADGALQTTSGTSTTTLAADDEDGHDDAASEVDVDQVVEVELSEFAITASADAFSPGETVEFVVTNVGVVEHEFRLSNQHRVDEHIAGGHEDHEEGTMSDEEMAAMDDEEDGDAPKDDGHGDEPNDAVVVVGAGETASMVFTFPDNAGDYTVQVCLIPGHYEAGMAADLIYDA